jgi:nicotinamide mononucleotide transporter
MTNLSIEIMGILNWVLENYIETLAVITGIIGVYLTAKQFIWCWPIGIINVILSSYVFFVSNLYLSSLLQVFYLGMSIYGWINWRRVDNRKLLVSKINLKLVFITFSAGIIASVIFGLIFKKFTNDPFPFADAFMMVWGVIATYFGARKIIEGWLIWIIIDLFSLIIYYLSGLYGFVLLYFVFCILAIYGYFEWRRDFVKTIKNDI